MKLLVELEREENGRWIAEVTALPGVLAYGKTRRPGVGRSRGPRAARGR